MAYDTEQEPFIRNFPPSEPEALIPFIDEELRKLEITLERVKQVLEEIDARLTNGGL